MDLGIQGANMKFSSSVTNKGYYHCCKGCIFNVPNNRSRYPCLKSHKEVRRGSGQRYERNFVTCGVREEMKIEEKL